MQTVLDYKCPACGGKAEFDSQSQMMKCPYCDTTFDVSAMEEMDQVLQQEVPQEDPQWDTQAQQFTEAEAENLQVFICNNCGGELLTDANTAATHCPYCDNPVVLAGRLSGSLKPDVVIPFQISKEQAKEALKQHCKGKRLLPKSFCKENRLEEIQGVYVPFWLFDTDVDADMQYLCTKVRTWSDSRYTHIETSYYSVQRSGSMGYENVPVDGSSKMPDEMMESIEPFDASQAVDFQTAYLSGYLADRYDVESGKCRDRANDRIRTSTKSEFLSTVPGYNTTQEKLSNIRTHNAKTRYALYPVWMLTTNWKGQKYTFAMNGQTGKFVGDLPMDKGAYWRWWAIWTGILSVGSVLGMFLLRALGLL
ncbi:MAG: hypothetical protein IKT58_00550 [Oscillospiraceae bacterium]|nr:hypothetical protein [Oscillospiraceae bacterium]